MYRKTFSFDDILLIPRYSELESRSNCDLSIGGVDMPIIMAPMDTVTSLDMINLFLKRNLFATIHRYFTSEVEQLKYADIASNGCYNNLFFAVGSVKKYRKWIDYLYENGVRYFCVDMAHGDSKLCVETVKYINNLFNTMIMAGNVVTKSGFERLQDAGASYIKVGIGCGSICSTRTSTGFGLAQGTAISDCANRKEGAYLIADGGVRTNGDIAKAIALGADFVMLGKMLASTNLADGIEYNINKEIAIDKDEVAYKSYHGMASREGREGVLSYSSVEGVSGLIPYTGTTEQFLMDLELNLKASLSYCGVDNLIDFQRKCKIAFISNSSLIESSTDSIHNL